MLWAAVGLLYLYTFLSNLHNERKKCGCRRLKWLIYRGLFFEKANKILVSGWVSAEFHFQYSFVFSQAVSLLNVLLKFDRGFHSYLNPKLMRQEILGRKIQEIKKEIFCCWDFDFLKKKCSRFENFLVFLENPWFFQCFLEKTFFSKFKISWETKLFSRFWFLEKKSRFCWWNLG